MLHIYIREGKKEEKKKVVWDTHVDSELEELFIYLFFF